MHRRWLNTLADIQNSVLKILDSAVQLKFRRP